MRDVSTSQLINVQYRQSYRARYIGYNEHQLYIIRTSVHEIAIRYAIYFPLPQSVYSFT